jgi:hypothetical protein
VCAIITFVVGVVMMMVVVYDRCFIFDESETLFRFDEEFDLYFRVFRYFNIYV